jgi:hypothetical protein
MNEKLAIACPFCRAPETKLEMEEVNGNEFGWHCECYGCDSAGPSCATREEAVHGWSNPGAAVSWLTPKDETSRPAPAPEGNDDSPAADVS